MDVEFNLDVPAQRRPNVHIIDYSGNETHTPIVSEDKLVELSLEAAINPKVSSQEFSDQVIDEATEKRKQKRIKTINFIHSAMGEALMLMNVSKMAKNREFFNIVHLSENAPQTKCESYYLMLAAEKCSILTQSSNLFLKTRQLLRDSSQTQSRFLNDLISLRRNYRVVSTSGSLYSKSRQLFLDFTPDRLLTISTAAAKTYLPIDMEADGARIDVRSLVVSGSDFNPLTLCLEISYQSSSSSNSLWCLMKENSSSALLDVCNRIRHHIMARSIFDDILSSSISTLSSIYRPTLCCNPDISSQSFYDLPLVHLSSSPGCVSISLGPSVVLTFSLQESSLAISNSPKASSEMLLLVLLHWSEGESSLFSQSLLNDMKIIMGRV